MAKAWVIHLTIAKVCLLMPLAKMGNGLSVGITILAHMVGGWETLSRSSCAIRRTLNAGFIGGILEMVSLEALLGGTIISTVLPNLATRA